MRDRDTSTGSILVVDDEKSIREIMTRSLTREGFDVVAVGNGFDALERISQSHFDLLFLDILMPEISGLDVLSIMHTQHPDIPVVMLTAVSDIESQNKAFRHEAFAYLMKPFKAANVVEMAKRLIGSLRADECAASEGSEF
ncbi:MAG: response regulator [Dehalococcoidia bacterium]|nr:response regulator [Dehalococcoidia bacterium]